MDNILVQLDHKIAAHFLFTTRIFGGFWLILAQNPHIFQVVKRKNRGNPRRENANNILYIG